MQETTLRQPPAAVQTTGRRTRTRVLEPVQTFPGLGGPVSGGRQSHTHRERDGRGAGNNENKKGKRAVRCENLIQEKDTTKTN